MTEMTLSSTKKKNTTKNSPVFTSPLTSAHTTTNNHDHDEDDENERMVQKRPKESDDEHEQQTDSDEEMDRNEIMKRKQAKRARLEAEAAEEKRLTSLLFGNFNALNNNDNNGGGGFDTGSAWMDEEDEQVGDGYNILSNENNNDSALFAIDRKAVSSGDYKDDAGEEGSDVNERHIEENSYAGLDDDADDGDSEGSNDDEMKSAWVDDDDHDVSISLQNKADRVKKLRKTMGEDVLSGTDYESRLRERFKSTSSAIARVDWADVDKIRTQQEEDNDGEEAKNEEDSSASKLLSSTAPLLAASSSRLQPHILSVVRCPDANQKSYNQSTIQAVQFHPGSDEDEPLMLTAGLDKALRFFKIGSDGENNEKVHGVNFPNFPIHSASFLGDTGSVIVSGRRPFFYMYDAEAGKIDKIPRINGRKERSLEKFTTSPDGSLIAFVGNDGYIILVEAKSKMWVADLKMNGSVRAVSFTPDGTYLISSGSDGEVYRWDLRTKKCVDKYQNQDGTITSYLSASSRFLAVGAESGVVNLYKDGLFSMSNRFTKRDPVKSIMNLHTSVDFMKFNTDGQILAMSSRREKDSLKLLHVPTQTVFSNWPTTKTPLSYVWSLDFSPGSKFMAVGNDKGKCLLYKLSHYHDDA